MKAVFDIPDETIYYTLLAAFEGGSNFWYHSVEFPDGGGLNNVEDFFRHYDVFTIRYDDPDDEEGEGKGYKVINKTDIQRGLQILMEQAPYQFGQMISEDGDINTGDCLLQCVVLGEIVYG